MVFPSVSMELTLISLVNGFLLACIRDVSGPIHYTVWDWVRTNDGILDLRGVCYVRFLVGTNTHSCIAWLSQSLSVPTGISTRNSEDCHPGILRFLISEAE
jgi:hypothetical protein